MKIRNPTHFEGGPGEPLHPCTPEEPRPRGNAIAAKSWPPSISSIEHAIATIRKQRRRLVASRRYRDVVGLENAIALLEGLRKAVS